MPQAAERERGTADQDARPSGSATRPKPKDSRLLEEDAILVAVATNLSPAADIARASGISILELARMVTTPRNLEDLQRVRQLHAIEREMMLGKLQRHALGRLAELSEEVGAMNVNEVRACEVMRKAWVDILRVGDRGINAERRHSGTGRPGVIIRPRSPPRMSDITMESSCSR